MYKFSPLSETKLSGCHTDLILLAHQSIGDSPFDFKITDGHRSPQRQFELYKRGRVLIDGKWVITDKSKVVTNIDGIRKKSNHNYSPARAFDIQILVDGVGTWEAKYYRYVADHIMGVANRLFLEGKISNEISWGGDWHSISDKPHFELK